MGDMMQLQDIIAEVYRYLDGDAPWGHLNRFLVPLVWDDADLDPETKSFVNHVYLRMAEFTSNDLTDGHPTEDELRQGLRELLPVTQVTKVTHHWRGRETP
jgi:hypothetical protein